MRIAGILKLSTRNKPYCEHRDLHTPQGMLFDWYEPSHATATPAIALPGVTVNSKDDPRLQYFARCLAASGIPCLAPRIHGLAECDLQPADILELVDFIDQQSNGQRLGLIGFSYGASYALLAAAHPKVASKIGYVLSFGAYHNLDDLFSTYVTKKASLHHIDPESSDWIYLHLVLAYRHRKKLELSDQTVQLVYRLLQTYCHTSNLQDKRAFYQSHLRQLDLVQLEKESRDAFIHSSLSPAGRLHGLRCPIGLLHDPNDGLIPADHAQALQKELSTHGIRHQILITPLLSHVDVSGMRRFIDTLAIMKIFLLLVRRSKNREINP